MYSVHVEFYSYRTSIMLRERFPVKCWHKAGLTLDIFANLWTVSKITTHHVCNVSKVTTHHVCNFRDGP